MLQEVVTVNAVKADDIMTKPPEMICYRGTNMTPMSSNQNAHASSSARSKEPCDHDPACRIFRGHIGGTPPRELPGKVENCRDRSSRSGAILTT
jgi:hypothetical protein